MTYALTQVPGLPKLAGGLDSYLTAVNRIPMLTDKEEHQLAVAFKDSNDLEAARALVSSHLRLVVSVARQYLGYGLPHADLIQEGNIGLMKAVKHFDPSRGVRLMSFAIHWIKAEIQEYVLRNWRLVRMATTKAQRKLFFNLRSMKKSTGAMSQKEAHEIANSLGVKPSEVIEMEGRFTGQEMSLEGTDSNDESFHPIDYLEDPALGPGELLIEQDSERRQHEGLTRALAGLDDRSRQIIQRRWLTEDSDAATLQDLSVQYGVSKERIRQIEVKAMQQIKRQLEQAAA